MQLKGAKVAVTGATGFLGRYIVDVLLARGARVIGVVRNPNRVPELAARGVELRKADLLEKDRLVAGFAGADALVSNAALFSVGNRNWQEHHRTNITGTTNVFEAVADAGVKRVVHVSSVAVYDGHREARVNEDHPQYTEQSRPGFFNAYPISKALSEQLAWKIARDRKIGLTTVRPCAIYGAHDENFMRIFKLITGGPIGIAPWMLRLGLVYAGDVAEAIALALESNSSAGKAYNVTGDDLDSSEFWNAWREAGGAMAWLNVPVPIPMTRMYDNSRAEQELGWRNRPFVEALRDTIERERNGG